MTNRPRSHQLEEESWKAFNNCIPNQWVLRKPHPDYGIDGEVEVFDKLGSSTGLMFFIQLKGTDVKEKAKALSFRFSLKTLRYYKSLPLPVLLIRYHSLSNNLYFKWASTIDPYYARIGSKTIKVDFSDKTRWVEKTPNQLVEYLNIFKQFTAPVISLPIEFRLEFLDEEYFSYPVSVVESKIREAGKSVSEFISFNSEKGSLKLSPRIKITNDLIHIGIEGLKATNLHLRKGYSKEDIRTKLPHDVFVGISCLLIDLGQVYIATEIASKHILSSTFLMNKDLVLKIANCFYLARKVNAIINLLDQLLDMGEQYSIAYRIFSLAVAKKLHINAAEIDNLTRVLLKAIEKAKEKGDLITVGVSHYNLGNRIRRISWKDYRDVFHHYHMASKNDPAYLNRDYYWAALGGILFDIGKYSFSEKFYLKSLEYGADSECIALRADALMFAGKYRESYTCFIEYENVTKGIQNEWALKSWILGGIIKNLGVESQKRHPIEAMNVADTTKILTNNVEEKIAAALAIDALCGLAWFNNGVYKSSKNEYKEGMISFLIAAIVQTNDIEAWSNAIMGIFNCPDFIGLLPSILSVAYDYNGEMFISKIALEIEKQRFPSRKKMELINTIGDLTVSFKENDKLPILRLIKPDGTYSVIDKNPKSKKVKLKEIPFPEFPGISFY